MVRGPILESLTYIIMHEGQVETIIGCQCMNNFVEFTGCWGDYKIETDPLVYQTDSTVAGCCSI